MKTPADLDAARALVERARRQQRPGRLAELAAGDRTGEGAWSAAAALEIGTPVANGAAVATVEGLRASHEVLAVHGGTVVEWLVEEGDPGRARTAAAAPAPDRRRHPVTTRRYVMAAAPPARQHRRRHP